MIFCQPTLPEPDRLMPIFTELPPSTEWMEPDTVPRPVVTVGVMMESLGQLELDIHHHRKGQFLLVQRGVLSCEMEGSLWIVPPQSAIWIPGGVPHSVKAAGWIEGYNAFIDSTAAVNLPTACCALLATPLLRELLIRAASFPVLYPEGGIESHVVTLLLDEIAAAPTGNLNLPMPTDARLRQIVATILADPADRGTIVSWAKHAGLSERSLARLITAQTGMSFGRWRQQLSIMLALQWLATGASIQQVSDRLGYESAGSFVTMFRKTLGAPPARYMAERGAGRA